ncbi:MAG: NAD(P)/FAD-dependent oxidoreductase [Streptosporangiaceae bacterium]
MSSDIRPTDMLVIGGGLNGCALAYYLTAEGITDVLLVEADELGAGATAGSMGNVRQQFGTPLEVECSRRGLAFWKSVEETFGMPCTFHDDGYLLVTGEESTATILHNQAAVQRACGMPDVQLLTPADMFDIAPYLDITGLITGSYTPHDGHVMPMDGVVALAAAARGNGARIEQHWPVERLERTASGTWRAYGPRGVIVAQRVVVVAGAGSHDLLLPFGLDIDIKEFMHYSVLTAPAYPGARLPTVIDLDMGLCVEREGESLMLAMLGRNPAPRDHEHFFELFSAAAAVRAPRLLDLEITHELTAKPTLGGDGKPHIGQATENLWGMVFTGHGAMHGPPIAEALAREIAGRPDKTLDLSEWDVHRTPGARSVLWRRNASS